MRVLMYLEELNRGGIESFVVNVLAELLDSGCEVSLLVLKSGEYDYMPDIERMGVSVSFLVDRGGDAIPTGRSARLRFYCSRMEKWMKGHASALDAVHVHASHLANMFPLMAAMRRAGCKHIVLHSHNSGEASLLNRVLHYSFRAALPIVRPETFIACSEVAGKWMFGSRDFETIPNGVPFEKYRFSEDIRSEVRAELGIDGDAPVIMEAARFSQEKNHGFLLRMFEHVLAIRPQAVLLLCGRGELLDDMKALAAELGISASILFLGVRDDVPSLLSAADCFVLPSIYEGLPVSAIEAQANGIPLLLSDGVSSEAIMSSKTKALPLGEGIEVWAREVVALVERRSEKAVYAPCFADFDSARAAKTLLDLYGKALEHGNG